MKVLTQKETEVMNILWKEHPLSASQIQKRYSELSIYSIQQLIQRLMKAEFIKVDFIDYSGKKLSRFFTPNVSLPEYIHYLLGDEKQNILSTAAYLVQNSTSIETLEKLEECIQNRLKEIES
ncbi:BlaI/MecI/CopY family transcriptional regulator [Floccifex sp.]|uniref:BlaI/MecI/CopY family transcriptional regulator n=1 Tax=Floccifex sp. TaxID=2815810 RepID=UPI003F0CE552